MGYTFFTIKIHIVYIIYICIDTSIPYIKHSLYFVIPVIMSIKHPKWRLGRDFVHLYMKPCPNFSGPPGIHVLVTVPIATVRPPSGGAVS